MPSTSETSQLPRLVEQIPCLDNTEGLCSMERASNIIVNGLISLDPKLGVFTVMGTMEPRVVKLFPKQTCSCPCQSNCYHVLAAQKAIGLHIEKPRRVINLTQLRRNKRKRCDKTSGRKRPRVADVDIIPAADAEVVGFNQQVEEPVAVICDNIDQIPSTSAVISAVRHFTDIFDSNIYM